MRINADFIKGWNAALRMAAEICDAEAKRMRTLEAQPGKSERAFQGSVADVEGGEALTAEDLAQEIRKHAKWECVMDAQPRDHLDGGRMAPRPAWRPETLPVMDWKWCCENPGLACVELARLRKLAKFAFLEGFRDGFDKANGSAHQGGEHWHWTKSNTRYLLNHPNDQNDP